AHLQLVNSAFSPVFALRWLPRLRFQKCPENDGFRKASSVMPCLLIQGRFREGQDIAPGRFCHPEPLHGCPEKGTSPRRPALFRFGLAACWRGKTNAFDGGPWRRCPVFTLPRAQVMGFERRLAYKLQSLGCPRCGRALIADDHPAAAMQGGQGPATSPGQSR